MLITRLNPNSRKFIIIRNDKTAKDKEILKSYIENGMLENEVQ